MSAAWKKPSWYKLSMFEVLLGFGELWIDSLTFVVYGHLSIFIGCL